MTDLGQTIEPKSDQLNADDLIVGPMTITVTRVTKMDSPDQPVSIFFEGDNGKPYKPCKSMRRVLVQVWGRDGASYVGKRMTLFRDPDVKFGGETVGGIRISHMSGISEPKPIPLTVTRGRRKPYVVRPLKETPKPTAQPSSKAATGELKGGPSGASGVKPDTYRFAGVDYDPAQPERIAPIDVDDMTDGEVRGYAKALGDLIRLAPDAKTRRAWFDANAEDIECVKPRNKAAHAYLAELVSAGSTATRQPEESDGAPARDGDHAGGAGAPFSQGEGS